MIPTLDVIFKAQSRDQHFLSKKCGNISNFVSWSRLWTLLRSRPPSCDRVVVVRIVGQLFGVVVLSRVCQEMPVYVGEMTFSSLDGTADQALADQKSRQDAWLKRSVDGQPKSASWRTKKRHRKGAYLWLVALHNQLKAWIEKGLFHFTRMSDEHGLDPTQWPRLSISPDQGSDGDPSLTSLHSS